MQHSNRATFQIACGAVAKRTRGLAASLSAATCARGEGEPRRGTTIDVHRGRATFMRARLSLCRRLAPATAPASMVGGWCMRAQCCAPHAMRIPRTPQTHSPHSTDTTDSHETWLEHECLPPINTNYRYSPTAQRHFSTSHAHGTGSRHHALPYALPPPERPERKVRAATTKEPKVDTTNKTRRAAGPTSVP